LGAGSRTAGNSREIKATVANIMTKNQAKYNRDFLAGSNDKAIERVLRYEIAGKAIFNG
jgi:hypothetical protein